MKNEQPETKMAEAPELTDEQRVEVMHKASDDFLKLLTERDIPVVDLPTVMAMIYNRAGQILQIPSADIVDESVNRLMAFQDLKAVNEGKTPQNNTMIDMGAIDDKQVESLLAGVNNAQVITPACPILTNEGIPIADENTWLNQ